VGLLTVGVAGDAALWEPNHPRLVRVELSFKRLPSAWNGLRIIQLSDFHYDPYFSVTPIRKAVEIVNALKPDLIALTGDFITETRYSEMFVSWRQQSYYAQKCAELLGHLQSRLRSFAILGNHDVAHGADIVIGFLEASGIKVLRNSSVSFAQNGARFWLAGVDDVLEGQPDLKKSLSGIPADEAVILLAHEPDFALDASQFAIDLQLSGHSHGGQIRVPFVGPIYLPDLAHKFPKGFYRVGNMQLYTNVGLGTITVPMRFDCPPEITLFTLHSAN
jgi:uncharacterized protein